MRQLHPLPPRHATVPRLQHRAAAKLTCPAGPRRPSSRGKGAGYLAAGHRLWAGTDSHRAQRSCRAPARCHAPPCAPSLPAGRGRRGGCGTLGGRRGGCGALGASAPRASRGAAAAEAKGLTARPRRGEGGRGRRRPGLVSRPAQQATDCLGHRGRLQVRIRVAPSKRVS